MEVTDQSERCKPYLKPLLHNKFFFRNSLPFVGLTEDLMYLSCGHFLIKYISRFKCNSRLFMLKCTSSVNIEFSLLV